MPFPVRLSGSNINKAYCAILGYLRSARAIHFPASPTRVDEMFNLLLVFFPLLIKKGALNGTACTFILCQVLKQVLLQLKKNMLRLHLILCFILGKFQFENCSKHHSSIIVGRRFAPLKYGINSVTF